MSDNNATMTSSRTLLLIFLLAVWQVEALPTTVASRGVEDGNRSDEKKLVFFYFIFGF
jgi:hypothetical protein